MVFAYQCKPFFIPSMRRLLLSAVFLEILSPPLIEHVPTAQHEAWELDNGSDVKLARGKLHMANFHTNQLKGCIQQHYFAIFSLV